MQGRYIKKEHIENNEIYNSYKVCIEDISRLIEDWVVEETGDIFEIKEISR